MAKTSGDYDDKYGSGHIFVYCIWMFSKIRRPPKTSQNRVFTCVYNYGSTVPGPFWGIFFGVETVKNLPSAAGCAATSQCAGKRRANRHIRLRG